MLIISRTRKEVYERWIQALRGQLGNYSQAHGQLSTNASPQTPNTAKFCCLGVLVDLACQDGGPQWGTDKGCPLFTDDEPSDDILNFMGLKRKMIEDLIDLNDVYLRDFDSIALKVTRIMNSVC